MLRDRRGEDVGLLMFLAPGESTLSLGRDTCSRLARLGVTRIVVLRDATTTGILLEGWALDPERAAAAASEAIVAPGAVSRVLLPATDTALGAVVEKGVES